MNDSLQQILTSSRGKILKKIRGGEMRKFGPKLGPNLGSSLFSQVWFTGFVWIAYNDSLQQCVTSNRGKTHKRNLGPKFRPKLCPKIGSALFFQVWFISFPLNYQKKLRAQMWTKRTRIRPKINFFVIFSSSVH